MNAAGGGADLILLRETEAEGNWGLRGEVGQKQHKKTVVLGTCICIMSSSRWHVPGTTGHVVARCGPPGARCT